MLEVEMMQLELYGKKGDNFVEIGLNPKGFFKYINSKPTVRPEISALK